MIVTVPISIGELFDKITILRVKQSFLTDAEKLANVSFELSQLEALAEPTLTLYPNLLSIINELHDINASLWDIEEGKRDAEKRQMFDADFIHLARQVYIQNDLRAAVKRQINEITCSDIVEEKSYS